MLDTQVSQRPMPTLTVFAQDLLDTENVDDEDVPDSGVHVQRKRCLAQPMKKAPNTSRNKTRMNYLGSDGVAVHRSGWFAETPQSGR